jgi:ATP-dependent RNA helicase MSS116
MQRDVRQLTGDYQGVGMGGLPTILVATPSRLLEHLEGNSPLNSSIRSSNGNANIIQSRKGKSKFASVFAETKIVVLDETDRLLQTSNRQETQKILGFMARPDKRQTLLFSATFPRAVRRFLSNSTILSKNKKQVHGDDSHNRRNDNDHSDDFLEVDCIGKEETKTSERSLSSSPYVPSVDGGSISVNQKRIEESFVVLENMSQFIPSLLTILRREQQRDGQNYKILVFFPAGRLVRFLFQFFTIGGLESKEHLWEIHSRMSQSSRTRASNSFREANRGILFSSDVSARGLDYPDVSLVVQMGAPSSNQDYIHRIGRTGRAGKVGKGILVLLPFEGSTERKKKSSVGYHIDRNLEEDRQLASWLKEEPPEAEESESSLYQLCTDDLEPIRSKVRSGHVVLTPGAEASYITFLAHYVATTSANPPNRKKSGSGNLKGGNRNNTNKSTIPPSEILAYAQDFVKGTGLAQTPLLDDEFASKLGLPNTNTEIDTQE